MPSISVIVPIYKVEQYLSRCIDSILSQSFKDFELILVDDGSPDNCGTICDNYAARDSRITVIHKANEKLCAARNSGMDIAQGDWLAFIDSDDWIHKDYLQLLYNGAEDNTDVVICDCFITDKETETDCDPDTVHFRSASLAEIEQNRTARTRAWGRLLRKKTVGALRYISGTEPSEDSCFNELFFRKNMQFRITDAKLYYYFMRPDSAIHNMGRSSLNSIDPLIAQLQTIDEPEIRERIIQRCFKNVFYPRYLEMFSPDYSVVKNRCSNLISKLNPYSKEMGIKKRIVFKAFAVSPEFYRLWRIVTDPTMLDFERVQKQKHRLLKDLLIKQHTFAFDVKQTHY